MWIRTRDENPTLWDSIQQIIPNETIKEIIDWRNLFRVMFKSDERINFYMIDVDNKIIALKDFWVSPHGAHLKLRDNGEGLISPRAIGIPVSKYEWDIIIPCEYSHIIDYLDEHGLVRVIKNGKWGIVDQFNNIVVPIEYNHLSPIYPLANGLYKVIAQKNPGEAEYNLFIKRIYSIEKGNYNVPLLRGNDVLSFNSND